MEAHRAIAVARADRRRTVEALLATAHRPIVVVAAPCRPITDHRLTAVAADTAPAARRLRTVAEAEVVVTTAVVAAVDRMVVAAVVDRMAVEAAVTPADTTKVVRSQTAG